MLSYRKLAMRVLGRPLHTGGGINSPRPASQRAAAFILTAAMLTTLAAPAFAGTWYIENGDITISAGETGNDVTQNNKTTYGDTGTIITGTSDENTVTIEAKDKDDKVEVTLKDVNINVGSDSGSALTSNGDVTLTLKGDNSLTGGNGGSGISSNGSLTITGGENDSLTAKGGSGRSGIFSSGGVTISGGSTVNATGGDASDKDASAGGIGILIFGSGSLTVSDSTVTATGGNGGSARGSHGGNGISGKGSLTVSGGTVTATGGDGCSGSYSDGGIGISSSSGGVTIYGGTVTATGGKSGSGDYSNGGNGIFSSGSLSISGGTVTATAGSSSGSYGRDGITTSSSLTISGGTVTANGGSGSYRGGSGIHSRSDIDLSGSLELTAKAGSPNGKALSQNGIELDPNTFKEKLDPGANIITKDADGKVINQVSIPRPVEPEGPVIPEESSSSSDSGSSTPSADGGSATPSAPASPLPGLTVTDKDGQRISYTSIRGNNVLSIRAGRFTASLRVSLAALRQLRAEGIDTITFRTVLCSTTLSVDELLAIGGEDTEVVLIHHIRSSTLTVGGKAV